MRKLLFVGALVLAMILISRMAKRDRSEWHGLNEEEARDRVARRLPKKVPEEKRDVIVDSIVTKMRDRGMLATEASDDEVTIELADELSPPDTREDATS